MDDLISIIVPVYNTEAYVEQCLKSIMNQTYKNIEIIVVDDGSTDNSVEKCLGLKKQDYRISVYKRPHGGVCRTRKFAVKAARGKYIGFVDSDDWIETDYFEKLYCAIKNNELVMPVCGYTKESANESETFYEKCEEKQYMAEDMEKFYEILMLPFKTITPMGWNKLFNTKLFQKVVELADESLNMGSDMVMTYTYLLYCNGIRIIDTAGYHYRTNFMSVTESADEYFLKNVNDLYHNMKRNIAGHYLEQKLTDNLKMYIVTMLKNRINYKLALPDNGIRVPKYYYPWYGRFEGKKIILYGAGAVGKEYYQRMINDGECKVVLWCDSQYRKYQKHSIPVEDPKKINYSEYDAIVIAVMDRNVAQEIKNKLIENSIPEDCIYWNKTKFI